MRSSNPYTNPAYIPRPVRETTSDYSPEESFAARPYSTSVRWAVRPIGYDGRGTGNAQ